MDEQKKQELTAEADGVIEGRNAVIEALRAGEQIDKIFLQKGETDKTLGHIASKARAQGIVNSLNASAAAAILLYEAVRQRLG